jgi:Phosphatidylglycerophosphatase A and related proteins
MAYKISHQWHPDVSIPRFGAELPKILRKREVLIPLAVGLALDNLATDGKLPEPLQTIISHDLAELTIDESLAVNIAGLYGNAAVMSLGHLDQDKIGIAKTLDEDTEHVNTFADDLAEALASAICARFLQHSVDLEGDNQ